MGPLGPLGWAARAAALALVGLASPAGAAPGYEAGLAALEGGRFREAWREMETEEDPLLRSRGQSEVLFRARRLRAALDTAAGGLASAPDDLVLLHRAAASALWLRSHEDACGLVERLSGALERASLDETDRAGWLDELAAFRAQCAELRRIDAGRRSALRLARSVTLGGIGAAVGLLLLAARPRAPTSPGASAGARDPRARSRSR